MGNTSSAKYCLPPASVSNGFSATKSQLHSRNSASLACVYEGEDSVFTAPLVAGSQRITRRPGSRLLRRHRTCSDTHPSAIGKDVEVSTELSFQPSEARPSLQFLDHIERGSIADKAGVRVGDFLLEVNGVDVSRAPHERVVRLIASSGDQVAMKIVTPKPVERSLLPIGFAQPPPPELNKRTVSLPAGQQNGDLSATLTASEDARANGHVVQRIDTVTMSTVRSRDLVGDTAVRDPLRRALDIPEIDKLDQVLAEYDSPAQVDFIPPNLQAAKPPLHPPLHNELPPSPPYNRHATPLDNSSAGSSRGVAGRPQVGRRFSTNDILDSSSLSTQPTLSSEANFMMSSSIGKQNSQQATIHHLQKFQQPVAKQSPPRKAQQNAGGLAGNTGRVVHPLFGSHGAPQALDLMMPGTGGGMPQAQGRPQSQLGHGNWGTIARMGSHASQGAHGELQQNSLAVYRMTGGSMGMGAGHRVPALVPYSAQTMQDVSHVQRSHYHADGLDSGGNSNTSSYSGSGGHLDPVYRAQLASAGLATGGVVSNGGRSASGGSITGGSGSREASGGSLGSLGHSGGRLSSFEGRPRAGGASMPPPPPPARTAASRGYAAGHHPQPPLRNHPPVTSIDDSSAFLNGCRQPELDCVDQEENEDEMYAEIPYIHSPVPCEDEEKDTSQTAEPTISPPRAYKDSDPFAKVNEDAQKTLISSTDFRCQAHAGSVGSSGLPARFSARGSSDPGHVRMDRLPAQQCTRIPDPEPDYYDDILTMADAILLAEQSRGHVAKREVSETQGGEDCDLVYANTDEGPVYDTASNEEDLPYYTNSASTKSSPYSTKQNRAVDPAANRLFLAGTRAQNAESSLDSSRSSNTDRSPRPTTSSAGSAGSSGGSFRSKAENMRKEWLERRSSTETDGADRPGEPVTAAPESNSTTTQSEALSTPQLSFAEQIRRKAQERQRKLAANANLNPPAAGVPISRTKSLDYELDGASAPESRATGIAEISSTTAVKTESRIDTAPAVYVEKPHLLRQSSLNPDYVTMQRPAPAPKPEKYNSPPAKVFGSPSDSLRSARSHAASTGRLRLPTSPSRPEGSQARPPSISPTPPPPPGFADSPPLNASADDSQPLSTNQESSTCREQAFDSLPLDDWTVEDVCDWLSSLKLDQYAARFREHEISGAALLGLGKEEFLELGVTRIGHRLAMERGLKRLLKS